MITKAQLEAAQETQVLEYELSKINGILKRVEGAKGIKAAKYIDIGQSGGHMVCIRHEKEDGLYPIILQVLKNKRRDILLQIDGLTMP